ncbi:carbohydrate-binding module family 20 protein [Aaosphaeria arxii CBS 175.79]|uniref:Glucoamylase n=1 Tax=Aaosphaeria arxii CBS 175.79 TaxID=1450172 RepID=A0A6A5Y974_9PLEO|nr:carbohydrate-binding module family 20 protein [Aaosphaeria arxii CBS 175.79]KAF2021144.1 carbohydrate-binding module family 20 protein [Aaosphaeria arxii CBS 175.79]
MLLRTIALSLGVASLLGATAKPTSPRDYFGPDLDSDQRVISMKGILDNIGPHGGKAPGALPGVIIASPSTQDPNYFFTWTRDAGLTMKLIVNELMQLNGEVKTIIDDYVKAQAIVQTVSNPSGALGSGKGLGEPKFYPNLTRFNGDWGRPQRDGPALRAIALITYANYLLKGYGNDEGNEVEQILWPVIQNDLNYVAQYWNDTGFDLWEEVEGSSFFATAVQHRALVEGAALGEKIGARTSPYTSQAPNILCLLQDFWNGKYALSNINVEDEGYNRTGLDASTVLTSLAMFDPRANCDDLTFQPCSPRALANLKAYVDSFRSIYAINQNKSSHEAIATGRYAEDIYYGGHPWYLTTFAVAEQLYYAIQQWNSVGSITITDLDLPFWQSLDGSAKTGTYKPPSSDYYRLTTAVFEYAEGFEDMGTRYIPPDGSLSEQYSRENGTQISARDLTWSYASFVTMDNARGVARFPLSPLPSWNSTEASKMPLVCEGDSVLSLYTPATEAGAPLGAGGCTVIVLFWVNATTYFGENLYLSGSSIDLGEWRVTEAVPGDASSYTEDSPSWMFRVELPADAKMQYQYVRKGSDGLYTKESKKRELIVPRCDNTSGGPRMTLIGDAWDGPDPNRPDQRL